MSSESSTVHNLRAKRAHSRRRLLAAAGLLIPALFAPTLHAANDVQTWQANATGNWSDSSKWKAGIPFLYDSFFPDNSNGSFTFDAVVNNGTVTLDQKITIDRLTFTNGTITGGNNLILDNGNSTWSGGNMTGGGTTTLSSSATLTLNNNGKTLSRPFTAIGDTAWTAGTVFTNNGTFTNNGNFDIQADGPVFSNSGGTNLFSNGGGLFKSAGSGTSTIGIPFDNTGSVTVNTGTLSFTGGGTGTALFTIDPGALLDFNTYTLDVGGDVTGAARSASGILTLAGDVSITTLQITAGTVTGPGNLTLNALAWTGGTMSGAGHTILGPGTTISLSNNGKNFNRTIDSQAAVTWTAGTVFANNGTFNNAATFDIQADGTVFSNNGGTNAFNNSGTLTKSGGNISSSSIAVPVNNTGSVTVNTGTLSFDGGGSSSGPITVAANAIFDPNTYTLNAGSSITGPGLVRSDSGILTLAANIGMNNLLISAGTVTGPGNLTLNSLNWTGGTLSGAGTTILGPGTTISLSNNGKTFSRTIDSHAAVTWTAGTLFANNGTFNNAATFDIQTDGTVFANNGGTNAFNNSDSLTKSGGNSGSSIGIPFNNSATATVNVNSGTLSLDGGGSSAGPFNVAVGATLDFNNYTLNAGANVTGPGNALSDSGTLTANANLTISNLRITAGTVNGPGNLDLGNLSWTGGTMSGAGITTLGPAAAFSLSGNGKNLTRTINSQAAVTWSAGTLFMNNGTFNNAGSFNVLADGTLFSNNGGANAFTNSGSFTKSGGSGTTSIDVPFNNTGSIDISIGTLSFSSTFTGTGTTINIATGATLKVSNGLTQSTAVVGGGGTFLNSGGTTTIDAQNWSPGATLNAATGFVTLKSDAGAPAARNLAAIVGSGASLTFNSSQHLASLTLNNNATVKLTPNGLPPNDSKLLVTNSLTMAASTKLDLADGDMIVQADAATRQSVLTTLTARIASARNVNPKWTGPGITTSIAPTVANGITGLAVVLNDNDQNGALYTTFDNEPVDRNSVLVKYTWNGDMDVNGKIDADDYFLIDRGFASHLTGYRNGDLDYNNKIDSDDYFLIDHAFLSQTGPLSTSAPQSAAAVPEPTLLSLFTAAIAATTFRKRRSQKF
jgi:hypothetical protein